MINTAAINIDKDGNEILPLKVIIDKPTLEFYSDQKGRVLNPIDISKFITNLNINEGLEGTYDSCTIDLKMDMLNFKYLFGDGLNQFQTNQMIVVKRPTDKIEIKKNLKNRLKNNINKENEINSYVKPPTKSELKKEIINNVGLDNEIQLITTQTELEQLSNIPSAMGGQGTNPYGLNPSLTDRVSKAIDKSKNINIRALEEISDKLKHGYEDIDNYLEYTAIFFGYITQVSTNYNVNQNGTHIFNITLTCSNFLHSFMNSEFLFRLQDLKYKFVQEEVDPNTTPNKVAQYVVDNNLSSFLPNKSIQQNQFQLDYLNNWIKNQQFWDNYNVDFTTGSNVKIYNENKNPNRINIRKQIKKLIRTFGQNVLPPYFQPGLIQEQLNSLVSSGKSEKYGKNSKQVINDEISGKQLNPGGFLKLGMVINVVTEQQHLPIGCDYRQFLPVNSLMATNISAGLKTDTNSKSILVPWNIVRGTFVPDPNVVECFPILIPIDNFSELDLKGQIRKNIEATNQNTNVDFIPDFNDDTEIQLIYDFYRELGAMPCIIYRYKLLDPDFSLNENTYKKLLAENYIAHLKYGLALDNPTDKANRLKRLEMQTQAIFKNIEFESEKVKLLKNGSITASAVSKIDGIGINPNQDACYSKNIPAISFSEISNFSTNNDEDNRINLTWVTEPQGGVNSGAVFDINYREQTVSNWYNILMHGMRILKIEYPFFDTIRFTNTQLLRSLAERLYSIYNEGNKRSSGTIVIHGDLGNILKGSWLRIKFNEAKLNDNEKRDINLRNSDFVLEEYFLRYLDFYCYISNINKTYTITEDGNLKITNIINFTRGKFGLLPTTFPEIITQVKTKDDFKIDELNLDKKDKVANGAIKLEQKNEVLPIQIDEKASVTEILNKLKTYEKVNPSKDIKKNQQNNVKKPNRTPKNKINKIK
jgi:hypothetical protein